MTAVEETQGEIIRELIAERQALRDANAELDADLASAIRQINYLEARLALEKSGYQCTCEEAA